MKLHNIGLGFSAISVGTFYLLAVLLLIFFKTPSIEIDKSILILTLAPTVLLFSLLPIIAGIKLLRLSTELKKGAIREFWFGLKIRLTLASLCIFYGILFHFYPPLNFPKGMELAIMALGPISLMPHIVTCIDRKKQVT